MNHKWENIDSQGTVGWNRCSECGLRRHFVNNEVTESDGCKKKKKFLQSSLADRVTTLLHNSDADTDTIRALLAKAIKDQKADSPYNRK